MKPNYDTNFWDYEEPTLSLDSLEQMNWFEQRTETAGFVPLEVRFKQMEQAGYVAQFSSDEFDSAQMADIYLNHPEFNIVASDELEEVQEKLKLRNAYINSLRSPAQIEPEKNSNDAVNKEEATLEAKDE